MADKAHINTTKRRLWRSKFMAGSFRGRTGQESRKALCYRTGSSGSNERANQDAAGASAIWQLCELMLRWPVAEFVRTRNSYDFRYRQVGPTANALSNWACR